MFGNTGTENLRTKNNRTPLFGMCGPVVQAGNFVVDEEGVDVEAVLDFGDPRVGQEYNKVDEINCPECGSQMDKTSDERQTHIWYESCPKGHGTFYDAGEFTDLKYDTFMDRLRDIVRGKRPDE